jgi:hypothetical protein
VLQAASVLNAPDLSSAHAPVVPVHLYIGAQFATTLGSTMSLLPSQPFHGSVIASGVAAPLSEFCIKPELSFLQFSYGSPSLAQTSQEPS